MVEENKEDKKSAPLDPPKPPTEDARKSTPLDPPKPPTEDEMSVRELRIARHSTKKRKKSVPEWVMILKAAFLVVLAVLVISEVVIFSSPYLRSPLKDWVTGIIAEQGYKREAKQLAKGWNKEYEKKTGEQLVSSGAVADGKMAATITGKPVVKENTVSFTVEWENKGSDSTYTPSDFVVDQGSFRNSKNEVYFEGHHLKPKEGYYNKVILPGQKKKVTYTYNLHGKKDDVKVLIGRVSTSGITDNADKDSPAKLVGTIIKVRGE